MSDRDFEAKSDRKGLPAESDHEQLLLWPMQQLLHSSSAGRSGRERYSNAKRKQLDHQWCGVQIVCVLQAEESALYHREAQLPIAIATGKAEESVVHSKMSMFDRDTAMSVKRKFTIVERFL